MWFSFLTLLPLGLAVILTITSQPDRQGRHRGDRTAHPRTAD
ncbi:hypothetical protein [Streptomyces lavendulae]|nr:hypothetical protein [Streptomyces lavendulae]